MNNTWPKNFFSLPFFSQFLICFKTSFKYSKNLNLKKMDHKTMFSKMLLSKRLNLANKNNCFFPEAPPVDKLTFRENETSAQNNENKENLADLINRTIKMKEKTISNASNLFSNNTTSCDKLEKSTPGFNKHQKKFGIYFKNRPILTHFPKKKKK